MNARSVRKKLFALVVVLVQDGLNKPTVTFAVPCPDKSSEKAWPSFHCNN